MGKQQNNKSTDIDKRVATCKHKIRFQYKIRYSGSKLQSSRNSSVVVGLTGKYRATTSQPVPSVLYTFNLTTVISFSARKPPNAISLTTFVHKLIPCG